MRRSNLKWALPILAGCLLSACSSDENVVETPQIKTITFGVTVNEASAPTTRSAEWDYEDSYTQDKKLALKWDNDNNGITLFPYNGSGWMVTQQGTLTVGSGNSKTVTFTANNDIKALTALFPYKDISFTDGATEIEMSDTFAQTGKDAKHLADYMYMYGYVINPTATGSTMQLNHIPAVLRSLVINKGDAGRIIKKVTIEASNSFHQMMKVSFKYNESESKFDTDVTSVNNTPYSSIVVTCSGSGTSAWNNLAANGAANNTDRLMAYALCFPTSTEQTYTFKVTATDADGTNETTYTSNAILSNKFPGGELKSGYYYTFELLLDDQLSVTLNTITAMPGWDNETDL